MGQVSRAGLTQRHVSIASASGHMRTLNFQPVLGKSVSCVLLGNAKPALDKVSVTHTEVPRESIRGPLGVLCLCGLDTEEHLKRPKSGSNTRSEVTPWCLHRQRCVRPRGNSDGAQPCEGNLFQGKESLDHMGK